MVKLRAVTTKSGKRKDIESFGEGRARPLTAGEIKNEIDCLKTALQGPCRRSYRTKCPEDWGSSTPSARFISRSAGPLSGINSYSPGTTTPSTSGGAPILKCFLMWALRGGLFGTGS